MAPRLDRALPLLAGLLVALLVGAQIWGGFRLLPAIESHTNLMLLVNQGAFVPTPSSLYDIYVGHGQLPITHIQALLAKILGPGIVEVAELYHVLLKLVLLLALYRWARFLDPAKRIVVLALLVGAFLSFPTTKGSFAYYAGHFNYYWFRLGTGAHSIAFLAIVLWLLGSRIGAYLSLFALSIFHPAMCVLLTALLAGFDGIAALRERSPRKVAQTALLALLAVALTLPKVLLFATQEMPQELPEETLVRLLAFANSRHLLPWRSLDHALHFIGVSLGAILMLRHPALTLLTRAHKRKMAYLIATVLAICLANIFAMEVLHSRVMGGDKIIGRLFVIVDFLFAILFVTLLVDAMRAGSLFLSGLLLAAYALFVAGFVRELSAISFAGVLLVSYRKDRPLWIASSALAILALAAGLRAGVIAERGWVRNAIFFREVALAGALGTCLFLVARKWMQVALAAGVLLAGVALATGTQRFFAKRAEEQRATQNLREWTWAHTGKTDVFLAPMSSVGFLTPSTLLRNVIIDSEVWDTFNYYPEILPPVLRALRVVYGVGMEEMLAWQGNLAEFMKELDRRFESLREEDVRRIVREYPQVKYALFKNPGTGELKERLSAFPCVFEDSRFLVFKIL